MERGARELDAIDRLLLDRMQRAFPLVCEPFGSLCEGLGIDSGEVLKRIAILKDHRLVRQISAIFNTGALGYRSSLVAMAVAEKELDRAAEAVNRYPGVSHNYLRPGKYNMWYTIAVPRGESLEEMVSTLSTDAGGWPTLILPARKKYKLAVVLDVLEEGEGELGDDRFSAPPLESPEAFPATEENVRVVKCIQEDLPLVVRPFAVWADRLGLREERLLELISGWITQGFMRRFAAILNHRQVGFGANGMVVWSCPVDRIDEYGLVLASHPEVSHCYHRPAFPEWPYNLYAMIHGRTFDECREIAKRLGAAIESDDYRILFSTREFKKIRLKLFWD